MPSCCICGGRHFVPVPGRESTRVARCVRCGSKERHRIAREIYYHLPLRLMNESRALQFSNDLSADPKWFRAFEVTIYGKENSLNVMDIDRPDGSYDWVLASHVIEHVENDKKALQEMARILTPEGVMHISIPEPYDCLFTQDWGHPDPKRGEHYRHYGSDIIYLFAAVLPAFKRIQVIGVDEVTGVGSIIYLMSRSSERVEAIARAARRRFPVLAA